MTEIGPVYGVQLIESLPLGRGGMTQVMPTRRDLLRVQPVSERTVAGYEVLLSHYQQKCIECERLRQQVVELSVDSAERTSDESLS